MITEAARPPRIAAKIMPASLCGKPVIGEKVHIERSGI